jgi:hypothetical protein
MRRRCLYSLKKRDKPRWEMNFKPSSSRHGKEVKHDKVKTRMRTMADWFMDIEIGMEVLWQIEISINLISLFIINSTRIFMALFKILILLKILKS